MTEKIGSSCGNDSVEGVLPSLLPGGLTTAGSDSCRYSNELTELKPQICLS